MENDPKSATSRRTLPLPERLVFVLRLARTRQARERLALGADGGAWEYVVCNEAGEPYSPAVLSRYWRDTVNAAGVRHIAARGTAYVRDPHALARRPGRGDRGVDRA